MNKPSNKEITMKNASSSSFLETDASSTEGSDTGIDF